MSHSNARQLTAFPHLSLQGNKGAIALAVFQCLNLVLTCIAYTITGAKSMVTIGQLLNTGFTTEWCMVVIMGAIELVLSQVGGGQLAWRQCRLGVKQQLEQRCIYSTSPVVAADS